MRALWSTVVLGWLLVGCAAGPGSTGEVEVEGLVLEDPPVTDADWRNAQGEAVEPARRDAAPLDVADLADGFATGGTTWSVADGEWVETSSRVLDRQRPTVAADVRPDGPEGTKPVDQARELACKVTLEAPVDRGLRAQGELEVTLVVADAGGREASEVVARWRIDVGLEAGQHLTAHTDALGVVERSEVSRVRCEVAHTPA